MDIDDEIIKKATEHDEDALLAIDSMVMSVVMEIYSLYGASENDIDAIVLTGSGGVMTDPIDINGKIRQKVEKIAPVSARKSLLDIDCKFVGELHKNSDMKFLENE